MPAATPAMTAATKLAAWLSRADDPELDAVLAPDVTAFDVGRARAMPVGELGGAFPSARVLAILTYDGAPRTMASDLSQQLRQIEDIPSSDLTPLILSTDKSRRADETAAEWMKDILRLKEGDASGVIVLWHAQQVETASLTETPPPQPRLVMIAFKLSAAHPKGTLRVQRLAYVLPAEPPPSR